jgi:hypothetical protein
MRSLGWTLIQYNLCPSKKRRFGHIDANRGERPYEETQGEESLPQGRGKGLAPILPHTLKKPLVSNFWPPTLQDNHFCWWRPPVWGVLLQQPLAILVTTGVFFAHNWNLSPMWAGTFYILFTTMSQPPAIVSDTSSCSINIWGINDNVSWLALWLAPFLLQPTRLQRVYLRSLCGPPTVHSSTPPAGVSPLLPLQGATPTARQLEAES